MISQNELLRRKKLRIVNMGNKNPMYGKTMKHTEENKKLFRLMKLGDKNPTKREEVKRKISIKQKIIQNTEEAKEKRRGNKNPMYNIHKFGIDSPMYGKNQSNYQKRRMKEVHTGKKVSEITKQKMREATINYIKNKSGGISPCIGHNEKQILDNLEKLFNYRIIRQYKIIGYFLDGYCKELNLAIEIDEKEHKIPNIQKRDLIRQQEIETFLGCKFLRIKDKYD